MWIAKFKIYDKNSKFRELVEKYGIVVYYYPINYYIKNKRYFFIAVGSILKNNNKFLTEFKKFKKTKKGRKIELLEVEDAFFTIITSYAISEEKKRYVEAFYNPMIIHIKPIIFHKDGWEEWEIASMERKAIEKLIEIGEKIYELKFLEFYKRKIKNFGFLTLLPELTDKQEKSLRLALESGYYSYPRKTSLDKLAKVAKLAFSTFQAHIRKAENKIISYVVSLRR